MNEKQIFESGCFLPSWAEDVTTEESPISVVYTRQNKDLPTLLKELDPSAFVVVVPANELIGGHFSGSKIT